MESSEDSEPELLGSALKDVIDARVLSNNLSEKAKQHYEKQGQNAVRNWMC